MASSKIQPENHLRASLIEFHEAMGQPILASPQVPPDERVRLRVKLIMEECIEFVAACFPTENRAEWQRAIAASAEVFSSEKVGPVDLVAAADALADILYVVEGTCLEFGIDSGPLFAEVHRSNMAKTAGVQRADGKILKPEGWTPPDVAGVLEAQRGPVVTDPRSSIDVHHDGQAKHWIVIGGDRVPCLSATYGDSLTREGIYSTHATARFGLREWETWVRPAIERRPWSVEFIYQDEGQEWSDLLAGIETISHRAPDRDGSVSISINFRQFYWGTDRKTLNDPPKAPVERPENGR